MSVSCGPRATHSCLSIKFVAKFRAGTTRNISCLPLPSSCCVSLAGSIRVAVSPAEMAPVVDPRLESGARSKRVPSPPSPPKDAEGVPEMMGKSRVTAWRPDPLALLKPPTPLSGLLVGKPGKPCALSWPSLLDLEASALPLQENAIASRQCQQQNGVMVSGAR